MTIPRNSGLPVSAVVWGRGVTDEVERLNRTVEELKRTQRSDNRSSSGAMALTSSTVNSIPVTWPGTSSISGFGLAGTTGFRTIGTIAIPVVDGKPFIAAYVTATASILDANSGGVASISARLTFPGGIVSQVFSSTKDAGASVVNNTVTITHAISAQDVTTPYVVEFQVNPTNPAAFPVNVQNRLSISSIVTYTTVAR